MEAINFKFLMFFLFVLAVAVQKEIPLGDSRVILNAIYHKCMLPPQTFSHRCIQDQNNFFLNLDYRKKIIQIFLIHQ